MRQTSSEIAAEVARRLELAMLLEVSAYPKPGNVHRTRGYSGTRFEHYLASAVACRTHFEKAAYRGILISRGKSRLQDAQVGFTILGAVTSVIGSHHGGNTSLGTVMLLVPLSVAAGMTFTGGTVSVRHLRQNLGRILQSTTPGDAVALYDAVARAKPGGLGAAPELDISDPASKTEILRKKLSILDILRLAADRDSICSEWATDYKTTFELGYPYFKRELSRTGDVNEATVNTYLRILSLIPDTLIARKAGARKARQVTERAKRILGLGGLGTERGRREIERLDEELRANAHLLNPGATADISASVLALATVSGYRP